MSNLYSIVRDTVNAQSQEDAASLLYGESGIVLNSQEYYQDILSKFIQKKEHIIRKENGKLIFDLNNSNDIWNVVFVSEYIKDAFNKSYYPQFCELQNELENLQNKKNGLIAKHKTLPKSLSNNQKTFLHFLINKKVSKLDSDIKNLESKMKPYKGLVALLNNINWVELENSNLDVDNLDCIEQLKQAVNIIQVLRCSINHDANLIEREILFEEQPFQIKIPIEYLDGFNKGRIIANEEDKVIVETTDRIVSPILRKLGSDVSELTSFFYNIEPNKLSTLLEYLQNDIKKLYQVPLLGIQNSDCTIRMLQANIPFEVLIQLPDYSFSQNNSKKEDATDAAIRLLKWGVPVEILSDCPNYIFDDVDIVMKLLDAGFPVNLLTEIPSHALYDVMVDLFKYGFPAEILVQLTEAAFVPETKKFLDEGVSLEWLTTLKDIAFCDIDGTIALYKYSKDKYTEDLSEEEVFSFGYGQAMIYFFDNGIDIKKLITFDENIDNRYYADLLEYSDEIIALHKMGFNLYSQVYWNEVDISAFESARDFLIENDINIKDVPLLVILEEKLAEKYPEDYGEFSYQEALLSLKRENIDISKLTPDEIIDYPNTIKSQKNMLLYLNSDMDLQGLPSQAFYNLEGLSLLLDIIKKNNWDIREISDNAFYYYDVTLDMCNAGIDLTRLHCESAFTYSDNTISLFQELKDIIYLLPDSAFSNPGNTTVLFHELQDKIVQLPYAAFCDLDVTLLFCSENIDMDIFKTNAVGSIKRMIHGKNRLNDLKNKTKKMKDVPFAISNHYVYAMSLYESAIASLKEGMVDIETEIYEKEIELYEKSIDLYKRGIDVSRLPDYAFNYSSQVLFLHQELTKDTPKDVYNLPEVAYKYPDLVVFLARKNIDVYNLTEEEYLAFMPFKDHYQKILELYSEGIEYLRLPFLDYCDSFNVKNIKYMLDKVEWDYEKLKQFPLEFFQCDFELLGTMFQTYNENVSKSIFGTNNPKIIAAVVYAHNVMRFYQSENQDDKNINVDVISFVLDQYYNEGQTMGQTTYYNQIAVGNDDEIKRFILNKIRNSSVHFRFRKVKDSDGKELEDKICIYDHDDQYDANGNPTNINFSAVIDIKDFVEIIHEIECDLEIIHPSKKTK